MKHERNGNLSVIVTTAADFCETRQNALHMRWPADADTTRRLEWVIAGGQKLSLLRRLLRRIIGTTNSKPAQVSSDRSE